MEKFNDIKYNKYRELISQLIQKEISDDYVYYMGKMGLDRENQLKFLLDHYSDLYGFSITVEEWFELCDLEIQFHKDAIAVSVKEGIVFSNAEENDYEINPNRNNPWQRFKEKSLKEQEKFDQETIDNIEKDVYRIIKNLSIKTNIGNPKKGLVIGGVQSGKTTNMASLIAMAADMGFNMFIVLSGMVENLRVQTEGRLQNLLQINSKNYSWMRVGNDRNDPINVLDNIYKPDIKFYSVVLKQKTRLIDLINWLQASQKIASKLKILIIDDESDQASVNTSKDPETDRKTINRLIVNLVHNRSATGKEVESEFEAVNYIGYTATPYANILSESPDNKDSLYPKDFIATLTKSKRHFGPTQIFGQLETENNGLSMVNIYEIDENNDGMQIALKEAIAYFIAASASLRLHKFNKPVSMLVQLSHKIDDHKLFRSLIEEWLHYNKKEVLELTRKVWEQERDAITPDSFDGKVFIDKKKTLKLHTYEEIEDTIRNILQEVSPIRKKNEKFVYHKGIHLVIDNSDPLFDGTEEYEHRLHYPSKNENNETRLFLVIGGNKFSRGLTLEGLISTYFERSPSAADTLTQMGRWFGYRINYELYPRVWVTQKTQRQFRYISALEEELREEIIEMRELGLIPSQVGPKMKKMPQYISITARNKSYAEESAAYDFAGYTSQTYIFDDSLEIQKNNLKVGEDFINSLGKPIIIDHQLRDDIYWSNIPFQYIKNNLLNKFLFNNRIKALKNIDILVEWIEKATNEGELNNWNIILAGQGKEGLEDNNWKLKHITYNMVSRTKKPDSYDGEIDIGVLRNPRDLFVDINADKLTKETKIKMEATKAKFNKSDYEDIRYSAGLGRTPQLIIYKIDKDSKPTVNHKTGKIERLELEIDIDLLGLYIYIPGRKISGFTTYVTVKIDKIPDIGLEEGD